MSNKLKNQHALGQAPKEEAKISLVLLKNESGEFLVISKDYKGRSSIQFPSCVIKNNQDFNSAAYKAQGKGDQFQQLVFVTKVIYEENDTKKEVALYEGKEFSGAQNKTDFSVSYMTPQEILNSPESTNLTKTVLSAYLNYCHIKSATVDPKNDPRQGV